ncbi:MAG: hypothetical protein ACRDJ9_34915, partial [Dehalococcoidia bacterium]
LPTPDVLVGVSSLVDQHLVLHLGETRAEPRFGLLETIREFGLEQLEVSGEAETIRQRHAAFFVAFTEALAPLVKGADTVQEMDRLGAELGNLRAAIGWALARGEGETVLRLASAIYPSFWFSRGDPSEGRRWLEHGLAMAEGAPAVTRVDAQDAAAMLAGVQGDYPTALRLGREYLALSRAHGYAFGVARAQFWLGMIAEWQGDLARAQGRYAEALDLMRDRGDPYWVALALTSLASWMALADKRGIAGAVAGLAGVATAEGRVEEAARLLGTAEALIEAIGVFHLMHPAEYERAMIAARAALGEKAFATAWAAGRALPLNQALAEAAAVGKPVADACPARLTPRELAVLRLLVEGHSER